jgi:aspartate/tyrosine/aromatic aminotransferase
MSLFDALKMQPDDPIFGIVPIFKADPRDNKINLSVGVYQDETGVTKVLDTVREAETLIEKKHLSKNYLPISGNAAYCKETETLIYGHDHPSLAENRVNTVQTVGASGALRLGAEFLCHIGVTSIAICNPSWANHRALATSGGLKVSTYTYYDSENKSLNFDGMIKSIEQLPKNSAILMHACCHNPTGLDPSPEQWQILSSTIKERELIPFFDCAYQGFKTSLDEDVYPIRLFAQEGHQLLVAYSFSKNMGLYGERAGALSCVSKHTNTSAIIQSYFKKIIRASYSSPAIHSATIVHTILSSKAMKSKWIDEVSTMRLRIRQVRNSLISELCASENGKSYQFLKKQCGMFSYTGLTKEQVQQMRDDFAIYMPFSGRINVAGLNDNNLGGFLKAYETVSHS